MHKSVLFICAGQRLPDYSCPPDYSHEETIPRLRPAGLANSARLVVEMLVRNGIRAKLVHARDNNDIDGLVTEFKPNLVVIEALWVVPEKFDVLKRLHPHVEWTVRLHSETPFLAQEGIALDWIKSYIKKGVTVSTNSLRLQKDLTYATGHVPTYTPNYYNTDHKKHYRHPKRHRILNIGCFGATRPLKNQLIQAIAAIRYSDLKGEKLRFHVNSTRENNGGGILKNLRGLFKDSPHHELVEHGWYEHEDFLKLLAKMDIGMQVSLTETFNIVSADMVSLKVPVVLSDEITWASSLSKVDATDVDSIVDGLFRVSFWSKLGGFLELLNLELLRENANKAKEIWLKYLRKEYRHR